MGDDLQNERRKAQLKANFAAFKLRKKKKKKKEQAQLKSRKLRYVCFVLSVVLVGCLVSSVGLVGCLVGFRGPPRSPGGSVFGASFPLGGTTRTRPSPVSAVSLPEKKADRPSRAAMPAQVHKIEGSIDISLDIVADCDSAKWK
jgi:hypothetical protein